MGLERLSIRYENLKLDTESKIRHYDHLALRTGTLLEKIKSSDDGSRQKKT
jgi:hypothetical protein